MSEQTAKKMLKSSLSDIERQMSMCIKCKMCTYGEWPQNLPMCPPYNKFRFFTYCGGGMLYLGKALDLGLVSLSEELLEVISKCTMCGFCGMRCELVKVAPPFFPVHELISVIKAELLERGIKPSENEERVFDSLRKNKNPFFVPHDERITLHKRFLNPDAKIFLFSGCANTLKRGEILEAAVAILEKAEIDFSLLEDEYCCGAPLLDMGHRKEAVELAGHNIKQIERAGAEKVIFLCPHCLNMFKSVYPQMNDNKIDAHLMFITQFVLELAKDKSLKFRGLTASKRKVAFHDPCYLARYLRDVESVRGLLEIVPSLETVEIKRSRYDTYCCGAGGATRLADPNYSQEIATERAREFIQTGAQELITSCPHCKEQFLGVKENIGIELEVKDALEILLEHI